MSYQASEKIQGIFDRLVAMPQVQQGLAYIKEHLDDSVEEQIEFCLIEAPTYHEEGRAQRLKEKFEEIGIENVSIDENNNVDGFFPGTEDGRILTEAHIDTVFPFGTVKGVRREGDMLYAPGIYDNARGIACLLTALRAMKHAGITPRKTVIVGGTSREEAPGGLGGMKDLCDRYPDIAAAVCMDGGFVANLTFNATYNHVMEYTFKGIGGHAFGAYGTVANPLNAASRAAVKIGELRLPTEPKTTATPSKMISSEQSGLSAIPDICTLYVNYRSDSEENFRQLCEDVERCVQEACAEETARWGRDTITVESKLLMELPGGRQDAHDPIVEADWLCCRYVGGDADFRQSGNANSNIPISRGIPGVTIGNSKFNFNVHSVEEKFCTKDAWQGPQALFLMILMTAGVTGGTESCMD